LTEQHPALPTDPAGYLVATQLSELRREIHALHAEVRDLRDDLQDAEADIAAARAYTQSLESRTGLLNPSLLKRAWTVWLYLALVIILQAAITILVTPILFWMATVFLSSVNKQITITSPLFP
jgi:hypothetical protein